MKKTVLVLCAVVTVACESGMRSPVSPSAVAGSASALNADGSNLKASAPLAILPLFEQTNASTTPTLSARAGASRYERTALAQRFQVSSDDFATIAVEGMGSVDASGVARFTVSPALAAGFAVESVRATSDQSSPVCCVTCAWQLSDRSGCSPFSLTRRS